MDVPQVTGLKGEGRISRHGSAPDAVKVKCDKGWKVLVCF